RNGTNEEKIKAAEELAGMGEKAQPAARALCEMALSSSEKIQRAALNALEKGHPDLHGSVFVLLVDANAENHVRALSKLARLGDQGKPAVSVIFHRIKTCQEQLDSGSRWDQSTLIAVIVKKMEVLPKIAPEEPQVV